MGACELCVPVTDARPLMPFPARHRVTWKPGTGNLLAMRNGDLCYLDFGMMSEAPQSARYVRALSLATSMHARLSRLL